MPLSWLFLFSWFSIFNHHFLFFVVTKKFWCWSNMRAPSAQTNGTAKATTGSCIVFTEIIWNLFIWLFDFFFLIFIFNKSFFEIIVTLFLNSFYIKRLKVTRSVLIKLTYFVQFNRILVSWIKTLRYHAVVIDKSTSW